MDSSEMLRILGQHGGDAGADFNDAEDVNGWFGWSITPDPTHGDVLTVTYEPVVDGAAGEPITHRWRLEETS
jgi:hypothetical protein